MKKLFISAALAFAAASALAQGVLMQTISDGQAVRSRTLEGNVLTNTLCRNDGAQSRCVSEKVRLSKQDAKAVRESFMRDQISLYGVGGSEASGLSRSAGTVNAVFSGGLSSASSSDDVSAKVAGYLSATQSSSSSRSFSR